MADACSRRTRCRRRGSLPRPAGVGSVQRYQSVLVFWSSIWVAALEAPKRKPPLPDGAELEPTLPNTMAAGPVVEPPVPVGLPDPQPRSMGVESRPAARPTGQRRRSVERTHVLLVPPRPRPGDRVGPEGAVVLSQRGVAPMRLASAASFGYFTPHACSLPRPPVDHGPRGRRVRPRPARARDPQPRARAGGRRACCSRCAGCSRSACRPRRACRPRSAGRGGPPRSCHRRLLHHDEGAEARPHEDGHPADDGQALPGVRRHAVRHRRLRHLPREKQAGPARGPAAARALRRRVPEAHGGEARRDEVHDREGRGPDGQLDGRQTLRIPRRSKASAAAAATR